MAHNSLKRLNEIDTVQFPALCRVKAWSFTKNGGFLRFFGAGLTPKRRFFASIGYQSDTKTQRGEGEMQEPPVNGSRPDPVAIRVWALQQAIEVMDDASATALDEIRSEISMALSAATYARMLCGQLMEEGNDA